jgi:predicted PurR-regulated permease PerM
MRSKKKEEVSMSDRSRQIEQVATLTLIALLILGSIMILLPFLRSILWAMVFGVSIWPLFLRLEKVLKGRTSLAALVPTLLLALIFFLPLVYVGSKLTGLGSSAFDTVQALAEKGLGPPPIWVKGLPLVGDRLQAIWEEFGSDTPKLIILVKPHLKNLMGSVLSAGAGMAQIVLTGILSLLLFFFVLKEGHAIRGGLEVMAVRLGGDKGRQLLFVAGTTMRSVVYGILGAALIQGILAVFGLWLSGVPNAAFIGTMGGFIALIPVGLIQLFLLPFAIWLIYQGQVGWGIFLIVWAFLVIGNIDNVVRPMLISRGAKVPFLVVLLGVLGGLASGGIIGLFVGATLLSVVYVMLKEWLAVPEAASEALHPEASGTGQEKKESKPALAG